MQENKDLQGEINNILGSSDTLPEPNVVAPVQINNPNGLNNSNLNTSYDPQQNLSFEAHKYSPNNEKFKKLIIIVPLVFFGILLLLKFSDHLSYQACIRATGSTIVRLEPAFCKTENGKIFQKNPKMIK
ncbi:MAG: hypothetical protein H6772_01585 [Pseudomonadales bacterium]|nr:hypothetical protein [Pseudomonadales bacterium]